jgi:rod shape determining protein RodA
MQSIVSKGKSVVARIDWWFIAGMAFLIMIGLIIQYSISVNQDGSALSTFYKQLTFAVIGIVLFSVLNITDYRVFKLQPLLLYGAAAALLIAVLLFGTEIKGTTGWFIIGPFSLQPVEFVKILFIAWLATTFHDEDDPRLRLRFFFLSGIGTAFLIGLILLQPDLGSSLILFCIWLSTAIFLRAPKWFLGIVLGAVGLASTLGWFFFFEDYQKNRLLTFIDPNVDPLGTGYNITQSIVAVGSGGLWGKGLGLGTQSQLHFLPEAASDFVFAVIAEELGFVGVLAIVIAIGFILWKLWRYIMATRDPFAFIFLFGTLSYLLMQSFLVMGMNIGIMPITGLPLPLISAGGSSFLATMILLGISHRIGTTQTVAPHGQGREGTITLKSRNY